MKNLIVKFAFILFAGTICSFQSPKPTIQEVFQTALDINILEEHFNKNNEGDLLPLTLISNDYIASNMPLNFAGNKVDVTANLTDKVGKNLSILELTEIKMKGKKSRLTFKYEDKTIKIRLKKEGKEWTAKTVSVKWKNGFDTQIVSTGVEHF